MGDRCTLYSAKKTSQATNGQTTLMLTKQLLTSELADDGILRLTLNDPAHRNPLSEQMMAALVDALKSAAEDEQVRVIILAANGPVFSAGHDIKQMSAARSDTDKGRAYYTKIFAASSALMQQIVNHPKPIIAEVAKMATAAGCQLVASCDLAVAGKSAHFATPGVHIGLFCSTPMVALSRNVANKHAMEMLLTGDVISAEKAYEIGLINKLVKDDALSAETMAMAKKIASKSAMTIKIGKGAFYKQREMALADAYEYTSNVMAENMLKHDAEEGINAFLERRKAKWRDE